MTLYPLVRAVFLPRFLPKIEVSGGEHLPSRGGFVLAPNHVDWLDGFYISAAVDAARQAPVKFLTASHNYWWSGVAIPIPVIRNDIVDRAVHELQRGAVICNFPEGQRNFSSQLLPGKTGTVRMAALANVPIIPVGVRCQPGQTYWQSIRQVRDRNHHVSITFGQPLTFTIPPGGIDHAWLTAATDQLMLAIASISGKRYDVPTDPNHQSPS